MNLVVLGATGSIGASTLDVAARHPERYRVFALTAHGSADQLARLCRRHRPRYAVLSSAAENAELRRANDILRTASAYFAQAELDRRRK